MSIVILNSASDFSQPADRCLGAAIEDSESSRPIDVAMR
jgi:hypothetical protein